MSRAALLLLGIALLCTIRVSAQPVTASLDSTRHTLRSGGISLVLSGGGAKGLAHIGVLEILDSARIPINLIVGTSMGASIGGLYAAGYSPSQLEQFALTTNWTEILDLGDESHRDEKVFSQKDNSNALLSLRFTGFLHPVIPQALSSGQRLTMLLNSMVMNAPGGVVDDFLEDLRVPFIAITTDIVRGERRLFTHGDLTEALRASATLPLRFSPLSQDSAILMDGGLLANIPVDVARAYGASTVMVSNATAGLRSREDLTTPWQVADQVITLMMQKQYAEQLRNADIILTPELGSVSSDDFSNIPAMIEAGRVSARRALPQILAKVRAMAQPSPASATGDTLLPVLREVRVYHSDGTHRDSSLLGRSTYSALTRSTTLPAIEKLVLTYYRSLGYSLARIDSVVIRPRYGRADFFIDEGHIARIAVTGNDYVHPDLVLREIPFTTRDIFRSADADKALRNLTGTGLFNYVTMGVSHDSAWPGTIYSWREDSNVTTTRFVPSYASSIDVVVQPKPSNVLRLGALADNEFGAQFSTELANENIAGSGIRASLMLGAGPLSRFGKFTVEAPRLFRSFATFFVEGYSNYKDINVYALQTLGGEGKLVSNVTNVMREARDIGGRLRIGGQVDRLGAVTAELRSERQRWFSVQDTLHDETRLTLTALRGDLAFDSRDDRDYPHFGTALDFFAETGLHFLGGSATYTKLFGSIEGAIPISLLHTLIPRIAVGFGDKPLPRLEQFELGGIASFYGLNEYELRGKQMVQGSLTYQVGIPHVLFFPTFVTARYDIGATWPEPEAIKLSSLLHGFGLQVGVKTPLGLARFGLGENFRFNKNESRPVDFNKPRFYFSIGSKL